jgi:hypothetical protein
VSGCAGVEGSNLRSANCIVGSNCDQVLLRELANRRLWTQRDGIQGSPAALRPSTAAGHRRGMSLTRHPLCGGLPWDKARAEAFDVVAARSAGRTAR